MLDTDIAIPAKYWIPGKLSISKDLLSQYVDFAELNEKLKQMMRSVEDLISLANRQGNMDKGTFVKQAFKPNLDISMLTNIADSLLP